VPTLLPEIHVSKAGEDIRMQEVQAKFNSAFNQISASQEMVSPKVGSPIHARSNQLLPIHTERSSKLDRKHSRIHSNHAFEVQTKSPPEEKPLNMSVNEWAEVLNYHRERDEEKIKKEREAAELKKQLNRLSLDK